MATVPTIESQYVSPLSPFYRDRYVTQLREELQQKLSKYAPFFTNIPASGKRVEFNGVGAAGEVQFRQHAYEKVVADRPTFSMRAMLPVHACYAMEYSLDDDIYKGEVAVAASTYKDQMSYAWARKIDQILLGVNRDTSIGAWRPNTGPGSGDTLDMNKSMYQGAAVTGLLGYNVVGESLTEREILPELPWLEGGTAPIEDIGSYAAGSHLDFAKTNIIPHTFVRSGTPTASKLTIDKIMAAIECFETRHALEEGEMLNMAITPAMKYQLMTEEKLQNADYGFQTLRTGFVSELLNVRFLVTPLVPVHKVHTAAPETSGDTDKYVRACPIWKTSEAKMGFWDNLKYSIHPDNDTWDVVTIKSQASLGACRDRKETVISVHVDDFTPIADPEASQS